MKKISDNKKNILDAPANLFKHLTPRFIQKTISKVGLPPGSIIHVGEQKTEKVKITLTEYDENNVETCEINSVDEIEPYTDTPQVTWVSICGLHETQFLIQVGEKFKVHPLVLEDILNTETRPKIEITDDYLFIVLKLINYNNGQQVFESEQVSFILGKNFIFSFMEKSDEIFNPIKERIKNQLGKVRKKGSDYLLYALMDIVVDQYFLAIEKIEEKIESLDDEVFNDSEKTDAAKIYNLKICC